jgi:hypothetical protein
VDPDTDTDAKHCLLKKERKIKKADPYPHQNEKSDPYSHKKSNNGKNLQEIFPVPNTVFLAILRHTVSSLQLIFGRDGAPSIQFCRV